MRSLILLLLLSFSAPALAIYKCEFSDKVVYSDLPCKNGKMKKLSIAPPLSDQSEAQQRLAHDKQQLEDLETQRHQREALEEKQQKKESKTRQAREKKCALLALRLKWAKEDIAHAHLKSKVNAQRKAQRASEKYQLVCER